MRIKVPQSRLFFDEILKEKNIKLKALSKIVKINYSSIKKYRRGELLIPEKYFNKLLSLSHRKDFWKNEIYKFEDNWGVIRGGKNAAISDKNNKRIEYARKFIKIKEPNIKLNEFFYEFYGALLGDGCISQFPRKDGGKRIVICIVGNKRLDSEYLLYLQRRLKKEFDISSYFYKSKTNNVSQLVINNKKFALYLTNFGFPIGLKYGKIQIPKIDSSWEKQKMVIRGLFDTDGSICAKKREGYKYPQISISSKDSSILNRLNRMLRSKGYPSWVSGQNISLRGAEATKKWFNDIGSSNNRNIFKYKYWLKNKVLPPKLGLVG